MTLPRAPSCIFWRRSPTSCGSRVPAISSATGEARSLVAIEAAAGLAPVVARAVTLLDAAWRAGLPAPPPRADRRGDDESGGEPGGVPEAGTARAVAER